MSMMRPMAGGQVPVSQLRLKLDRSSAELKSKGTIEDPVGAEPGWSMDRLDSFGGQLRSASGLTLSGAREAALEKAEVLSKSSDNWLKAGLGAFAVGAGVMLAAPFLGPVIAGSASLGAVGLSATALVKIVTNSAQRSEHHETIQNLDAWGAAFESQGAVDEGYLLN